VWVTVVALQILLYNFEGLTYVLYFN